jgi:carboxylate-amine ligase
VTAASVLPAFAGYGIELEYAIVDRTTLDVRPITDAFLQAMAGTATSEVRRGSLGWSNELALHVVELKNIGPVAALQSLAGAFQDEIRSANRVLSRLGARLMPSAMHPWMNPLDETRLWMQQGADIYRKYDDIFNCRRHGWSNIQSMHINLPFANDAEFARLHAAIRLILPLLPALAASSPLADERLTGWRDYRLEAYRSNSLRMPTVTGDVIPENVASRAEYSDTVLAPMYAELQAHDPRGILRHEWLNAHGAIARFDRNAIELRLADTQECPRADIAIATATVLVIHTLYDEGLDALAVHQRISTRALARLLQATTRDAEDAVVDDPNYLRALGVAAKPCRARDVWAALLAQADHQAQPTFWREPVAFIQANGTLATRILRAVGACPDRARLRDVYGRLCDCLDDGALFN